MNEITQLLNEIVTQNLYQDLIKQLEKDFLLSNENIEISEKTTPQELISVLHQKIHDLISFKFNEYLNLLYIIDISENLIKSLDGSDLLILSKEVSYLILKREWQKVYYRNLYK
jgi:hypothetical protein